MMLAMSSTDAASENPVRSIDRPVGAIVCYSNTNDTVLKALWRHAHNQGRRNEPSLYRGEMEATEVEIGKAETDAKHRDRGPPVLGPWVGDTLVTTGKSSTENDNVVVEKS
jgi:hypothetical protein